MDTYSICPYNTYTIGNKIKFPTIISKKKQVTLTDGKSRLTVIITAPHLRITYKSHGNELLRVKKQNIKMLL